MEEILIQRTQPGDLDDLQRIGITTFTETFAADNSEENLREYLDKGFSSEKLKKELADPNSEFYFAVRDGEVIGYLKVNSGHSQTEMKDENSLEIERIYVLKKFHGHKAGQKLFEKALQIAEQKNVDHVWLGVWKKNIRAIRFYEKNGFAEFDKHLFKLGNDEQTDIMMKLPMNK